MDPTTLETLETAYTVSKGVHETVHEAVHETTRNRLETLHGLSPSQAQLADAVGVSTQAFGRSWLKWIFMVKDKRQLQQLDGYSDEAIAMVQSLAHYRAEGMNGRQWVEQIAKPQWGIPTVQAQVIVDQASAIGAIIPAEVHQATSSAQITLATAQQARASMASLMDAVIEGLHAEEIEVEVSDEMTAEHLIELDEMRKIAKEQQIRARVRAQFQQRQQAAQAQRAQQQIDGMSGRAS